MKKNIKIGLTSAAAVLGLIGEYSARNDPFINGSFF